MFSAKVICDSVTEQPEVEGQEPRAVAVFRADYAGDRNKEWAVATPDLQLRMTLNGVATNLVTPGRSYTLLFEED